MRFALASLLLLTLAVPSVAAAQDNTNILRPGDELLMRVWPDTTLSGRYRVESDGKAYLPMLGAIQVANTPLAVIRQDLIDRYSEIMRLPVVVIVPRFRASILGGVRAPGLYFVEAPTTLMDLVSMAGGFTDNAKTQEVRLLRGTQVFGVDAKQAMETGAATATVALESGDRIVVPTSSRASLIQALQILISLATLTTIIVR